MQPSDEIARQKRAVTRHAHDPFDLRRMAGRPIEAGENAGQRARVIRHPVGHDRQAKIGKARRVVIGVDDGCAALCMKPRQHAFENGRAADPDARLVAATHPARTPAGEYNAEGLGMRHETSACLETIYLPPASTRSICAAVGVT
jgi:hypothetical protein